MRRVSLPFLTLSAALGLGPAPGAFAAPAGLDRVAAATTLGQSQQGRIRPAWLSSPGASDALLAVLRHSPIDGLEQGPELAAAIERLLAEAQAGVPNASTEAERMMSGALILHAQALRWPGEGGIVFADAALAPRVPQPADILREAAAAPDLAAHVLGLAKVNPIYAALRDAAQDEVRFLGQPSRALRASLDRARVLPASGRWVMVDIPSQTLFMMEDGRPVDRMRVVVGKPEMKTPQMAGTLRQVTFNPYWNVPVDLAASRIAPNVLRGGVRWFRDRGYEVLSGWEADATVLDPESVDWQAVADGRIEARVRQKPGANNMMGDMKFQFPNTLGIYLHDTPDRGLFDEAQRAASSGCVRLEDAARLGRWLLGREPKPSSDRPEYQVPLADPVPVFLTYLTVKPGEDGGLAYSPDIYGLDSGERLAATGQPG